MTVDEAFEKYSDETIMQRKKDNVNKYSIAVLKAFQAIAISIIFVKLSVKDDIKADDWEVVE